MKQIKQAEANSSNTLQLTSSSGIEFTKGSTFVKLITFVPKVQHKDNAGP